MQIGQFARFAQNYAVRLSEFVRKVSSLFARAFLAAQTSLEVLCEVLGAIPRRFMRCLGCLSSRL